MLQMFTGSILRLAVTVGTLAAIYLFIVRPVLDTTTETLENPIFSSPADIQREIGDVFDDHGVSNAKVPKDAGLKRARKMLACVERAGNDTAKLSACATR